MLFATATYGTKFASNRIEQMSRGEGMDAVVTKCMQQIRQAIQLPDLADPDWARLKAWPAGSASLGWSGRVSEKQINEYVDKLQQPLGSNIPLFYGNSEVSKNGNLHGWVEGALEMVEEALPRI